MATKSKRAKGKSTSKKSSSSSSSGLAVSGDGRKPVVDNSRTDIVHLDDERVQHFEDARIGRFVTVTGGKYKGAYGVLEQVSNPDKYGYPRDGVVRTRDDSSQLITVKYKDLKDAQAGARVPGDTPGA